MEKSLFTREHRLLVALLREMREEAQITQMELATKIGQSQSFVTKAECGERRLDLIQLRNICQALGTSLPKFVARLETRIKRG